MASKKNQPKTFLDEEIDLQESYGRAEQFVEENKTKLMAVVSVIGLLMLVIFWFRGVYIPDQETSAQEQMFVAQQHFEKDSFNLALNGDGNYPGFLEIIDSYSGMTSATNLAKYYSGICYLNLGEHQNAIDYLGQFKGKDKIVSSMALGAMGDAYMELGNMSSAISYYNKAANNSDNKLSAPLYLMKKGNAMELENNFSGANQAYQRIKSDYPESLQAQTIDQYIARTAAKI